MQTTAVAIHCQVEDATTVIRLTGTWRLRNLPDVIAALGGFTLPRAGEVVLDGGGLESIDTAAAFVLLERLAKLGCAAAAPATRHFSDKHARLVDLVRQRMCTPTALGSLHRGVLYRIGAASVALLGELRRAVSFMGLVTIELLRMLRRPALFRARETAAQFETVCIDAIPIVILVNFLIGIVVAYVLGMEAQRYGASLFVADGIALAMCRELSPILCSVLVAGRSGAAFTAEIGTMKVEEEVDAIATLGLSPVQVLVIPRLLALGLALPLLVLAGDIAGVAGGMLVGAAKLGIAPNVFLDRVHAALELRHFLVGPGKAPVFAMFIAMIACRLGLEVKGDARSVGRNTTSTVVQCIVWVFVLDAAFAVVFQRLDI
ncbi:MAG TPA: ABC transporter permease [Usitatibacter sp.]|nr:ABC transporter permease [Usitatibacter sp.]